MVTGDEREEAMLQHVSTAFSMPRHASMFTSPAYFPVGLPFPVYPTPGPSRPSPPPKPPGKNSEAYTIERLLQKDDKDKDKDKDKDRQENGNEPDCRKRTHTDENAGMSHECNLAVCFMSNHYQKLISKRVTRHRCRCAMTSPVGSSEVLHMFRPNH